MSKRRSGFGSREPSRGLRSRAEKEEWRRVSQRMDELQTPAPPATQQATSDTCPSVNLGNLAGDVALRKIVILPVLKGEDRIFQLQKLWLGRFAASAPLESAVSRLGPIVQRYGGSIRPYEEEGVTHYRFEYLDRRSRAHLGYESSHLPDKSVGAIYAKLANRVATYEAPERLALEMPVHAFLSISSSSKEEGARLFRGKVRTVDANITQTIVARESAMPGVRIRSIKASVTLGTIVDVRHSGPRDLGEVIHGGLRTVRENVSLDMGPLIFGYGPVGPHLDTLRELQDIDACRRPRTS